MNNDLISRSKLKKALKSNCDTLCNDKNTNWCEHCCPLNDFEDLIDNAPTVDINKLILIVAKRSGKREMMLNALRPQGTWDYEQVALYGVCSNCGVAVTSNLADMFLYEEIGKCPYNINFCPNCGAYMRKGGTDEAD